MHIFSDWFIGSLCGLNYCILVLLC